eukprot:PITA_05929
MEEQKIGSRTIMVAMNDTEKSYNALQWALHKLIKSQDRIILLHAQHHSIFPLAVTPDSISYSADASVGFMLSPVTLRNLEDRIKISTEKIRNKAMAACKAKNVTPEMEVRNGDAREVLCNAAKEYNPDMLVIGGNGHGFLKRLCRGSVSDHCVQHLQCPVVVVKPQKKKAH